jgi:Fic family protein
MMLKELSNSPCGSLVSIGKGLHAYVPKPVPRQLTLNEDLIYKLDEASRSVATLAGVGETIPNPHLLIRPFMRLEAVLSSKIEGTQASLSDLFIFEVSGQRRKDVLEVANYIQALDQGIRELEKLPISVRLVNNLHETLLTNVRGHEKRPGLLRDEQVWIGPDGTSLSQARFVPPPPSMVRELMYDLELFINEPSKLPPLIQCAAMHYQFETIHPYLDGNGRIGRLLITLFLYWKKVLPTPLLYLSAYFERDKGRYYDELYKLSASGDWNAWFAFFLQGVTEQSRDALRRVRRVRSLQEEYRRKLSRETGNVLRVVDELFAAPYVSAPQISELLKISRTGAANIIDRLVSASLLMPVEGTWPHLYVAKDLLDAIEVELGPEPRKA